jgi:DNA-binding CsgD family transcriptional regulator
MTLDTAVEFAIMLTDQDPQAGPAPPATGQLSAREQELVTLVARGHTDTQIAGQLYISVRTVRSHLDRIRDKSGCRRRADLTRLAASRAHLTAFPGHSPRLTATVNSPQVNCWIDGTAWPGLGWFNGRRALVAGPVQ